MMPGSTSDLLRFPRAFPFSSARHRCRAFETCRRRLLSYAATRSFELSVDAQL
jgi:hypothetical protein